MWNACLILFFLFLSACGGTPSLPPQAGISRVELAGEISTVTPHALAVDGNRIYLIRDDYTVAIIDERGQEIFLVPTKDATGRRILKKPSALALGTDRLYITDRALDHVAVFSKNGDFMETFGRSGSDPKEFDAPQGITCYQGVVYVADTGNSRIQVFGSNGMYLYSITGKTAGADNAKENILQEPVSVNIDPRGHFHVLDHGDGSMKVYSQTGELINHLPGIGHGTAVAMNEDGVYLADLQSFSIRKYDFDQRLISTFGTKGKARAQFESITGLATGSDGKVYVADKKKDLIHVFTPEHGNPLPFWQQSPPPTSVRWLADLPTNMPIISLAWGGNDIVYGVDGHKIHRFSRKNTLQPLTINECSPWAITTDPQKNLWVLDQRRKTVMQIDEGGQTKSTFTAPANGPGALSLPQDIAVSGNGTVYIADPDLSRIQIFNRQGIFLNALRQGAANTLLSRPTALALDREGILYVLDTDLGKVLTFDADGRPLSSFGNGGENPEQLAEPVALFTNNNEVFIVDNGTHSIKVFNRQGQYIRQFGTAGEGHGDFHRPLAATAADDVSFLVSDPGNARIAMLANVYTPQTLAEVTARKGMREISLSWRPAAETFVDAYRIYRAENREGQFRLIDTSSASQYRDRKVEPDKTYFYTIAATARSGNEGPRSPLVGSTPSTFLPGQPGNLQAQAGEWSVHLSWDTTDTEYISHYLISRFDNQAFRQLGRSETCSFDDTGLQSATYYSYEVKAVSIDGRESKAATIRTATAVAQSPPLTIEVNGLAGIFSNTYKIYEKEGLGRVRITNSTGRLIPRVNISFSVREFMDFPSEMEITDLGPGQSQEIPVKAVFNNNILTVTEDTPVQTEITAVYYENNQPRSFSKSQPVTIYEKHRMMWDARDRFATFITPKDPVLLEFVRQVVTATPQTDDTLKRAAAIFRVLGSLGLTYMQDPSNPYQITSEQTDLVDYIQYPRETLQRKSGDCDDLVALYTAALESLGIRTKAVEVPGHMLMMFTTGIGAPARPDTMDELFVIHDGAYWVPVETTMVGGTFMKAWEEGSKTYYQWLDKDLTLLDIHHAWLTYKPATLPASEWRPPFTNTDTIEAAISKECNTLRKISLRLKTKPYLELLEHDSKNVHALLQIGIIYGKGGDTAEAQLAFEKVLSLEPMNVEAINNIGNLYFLQHQYHMAQTTYEKAVGLDGTDPLILVNLAQCYMQLNQRKMAQDAFNRARKLDGDIGKIYRGLAIELAAGF